MTPGTSTEKSFTEKISTEKISTEEPQVVVHEWPDGTVMEFRLSAWGWVVADVVTAEEGSETRRSVVNCNIGSGQFQDGDVWYLLDEDNELRWKDKVYRVSPDKAAEIIQTLDPGRVWKVANAEQLELQKLKVTMVVLERAISIQERMRERLQHPRKSPTYREFQKEEQQARAQIREITGLDDEGIDLVYELKGVGDPWDLNVLRQALEQARVVLGDWG